MDITADNYFALRQTKRVAEAISRVPAASGRKDFMQLNMDGKLTSDGSQLSLDELAAAFAGFYTGRADLFPEIFPERNGKKTPAESQQFWGPYYDLLKHYFGH